MAQRRMFSLQVVDTDAFLEMPLSAQALYFHLGMRADDDGFVSNSRRIQKMVGAAEDDLKLLLAKRFLLPFDTGIVVLKHWKICNYIQKDRYRPTLYKDEKAKLFLKSDGAYTDHPVPGAKPCLPQAGACPELPGGTPEQDSEPGNNLYTDCIHRIGKDRLGEDRLGKVRLGKFNNISGGDGTAPRQSAVREYIEMRGMATDTFFGNTDEIEKAVKEITEDAFELFSDRKPIPNDVMNVYTTVSEYIPDTGKMTISKKRVELLLYAMEQAASAGKAGQWPYIFGVLAKLSDRGITELADAEVFDETRR